MSKKWLTIVQNDSAEDATFTSVYCWRVLAGAQRRAWEVPAGAQRRAGTGGLTTGAGSSHGKSVQATIRFAILPFMTLHILAIAKERTPRCL